jgi:putative hydrolase of the HAD superfamily
LGASSLNYLSINPAGEASVKKKQPPTHIVMSKIRAVFFDLDNTLIDFLQMKQESCKAAADAMVSYGLQMTNAGAYDRLMKVYFSSGIESDIAFTEFLKRENQFDHKILAAAINAYLDAKAKNLKPYPNVKPTLRQLTKKGIFLSIVTDAPKTKAYQRLLGMKIEPFFKFVVGYEDTNQLKATGLPFRFAIELLKKELGAIRNEEILMVGDSMERDIIPAKRLGLQTALSKYGEYAAQVGTGDFELKSFSDLLSIL